MARTIIPVALAAILTLGIATRGFPQSSVTVPQAPPLHSGFGHRGPGGPVGNWGGKTVTGAPFTAQATTATVQKLADGNTINRQSTGTIARDSAGRTRWEMSPHFVSITDPVAGMNYRLDTSQKTARQFAMRQHEHLAAKEGGATGTSHHSNTQTATKSLGQKTIEGLTVEGTRITRTIPAGRMGNTNPIVITIERWYSPDLQMNIQETRSDPRFGTSTHQLTNISRQEPATSMFTVPPDFSVTQGRSFSPKSEGSRTPNSNPD